MKSRMMMLFIAALSLQLTSCDHPEPASNPQATRIAQSASQTPSPDMGTHERVDTPDGDLPSPPALSDETVPPATLPRLVDLGAGRCIPCRMMAPILDDLREEYRGTVSVEFIDVLVSPELADVYEVQIIPTQVFYDASGSEVHRHTGFMPQEEILAQFRAMGIPDPSGQSE